MRVLLTNNTLADRAGTELYVRDVAIELLRRGHHPVAYSSILGPVAAELRAATVPVISSLESLGEPPDIIHGHHHYDTLAAMHWFPDIPTVYFCHGWLPWEEMPLRFPRITQYVAVDELCRERLIVEGGVSPGDIEVILNFFDEEQFPPRPPLPEVPRRVLAFGNMFAEDTELPMLREACVRLGLGLDVAGLAAGVPESLPSSRLAEYDVVFAKARAAIEAMAVGAAVVLCAWSRIGPMVTSANFEKLRPLNFGVRTLSRPLTTDRAMVELQRYSAADATTVSKIVRQTCEMKPVVDQIISVYEKTLERARAEPAPSRLECDRSVARYLEQSARIHKQSQLGADREWWIRRCLAAEERLEDISTNSPERRAHEEDRTALRDQIAALKREVEHLRSRVEEGDQSIAYLRDELADEHSKVGIRDGSIALLQNQLADMKASTTWRWSQGVLENPHVQRIFGRVIRFVAQRTRQGAC